MIRKFARVSALSSLMLMILPAAVTGHAQQAPAQQPAGQQPQTEQQPETQQPGAPEAPPEEIERPRKIEATNTRNGRSTLEVAPVSLTGLRRNSCAEEAVLPQWARRAITANTLDCGSTSSLITCPCELQPCRPHRLPVQRITFTRSLSIPSSTFP